MISKKNISKNQNKSEDSLTQTRLKSVLWIQDSGYPSMVAKKHTIQNFEKLVL